MKPVRNLVYLQNILRVMGITNIGLLSDIAMDIDIVHDKSFSRYRYDCKYSFEIQDVQVYIVTSM